MLHLPLPSLCLGRVRSGWDCDNDQFKCNNPFLNETQDFNSKTSDVFMGGGTLSEDCLTCVFAHLTGMREWWRFSRTITDNHAGLQRFIGEGFVADAAGTLVHVEKAAHAMTCTMKIVQSRLPQSSTGEWVQEVAWRRNEIQSMWSEQVLGLKP